MKAKRRKIKTHFSHGIAIRELRPEDDERGGYFQVDFQRNKKRVRKGFKTLAEAKTYCRLEAAKIEQEGSHALSLTPTQRDDAAAALSLLDGNSTLLAAARFWKKHNGTADGVTVEELGESWIAYLKDDKGCRPNTLEERTYKLNRLSALMGPRKAQSIMREDMEAALKTMGQGETRDGFRRAYHAMFRYGVKKKLVDSNPLEGIERYSSDETLPTPFTTQDTQKIMQTAEKNVPAIVPELALQFFAGLRPGEAKTLDWKNVDFKHRLIRVMPETSKRRRTRVIEKLPPALFAWLAPYRRSSGFVGVQGKSSWAFIMHKKRIGLKAKKTRGATDKRPKGILEAAGVKWIQDGPRKTFATMHFAMFGDAGKTMGLLGHSGDPSVFYNHYRGLATKAEAKRFFAIRPATKGNVRKPSFRAAAS